MPAMTQTTLNERLAQALRLLRAQARPDQLEGMARFGLSAAHRLGVSVPVLRRLGRELGRDHDLALALVATGIPDAQILAAYIAQPARLTDAEMDDWVARVSSWDTCDQACTNAFARSPLAWGAASRWVRDEREFVRRAGFALLAALAVHDKKADDDRFAPAWDWIEAAAADERNFVKKAVNWALRQIGKRNDRLLRPALACAERLRQRPERSARWIANDALRELRARSQP